MSARFAVRLIVMVVSGVRPAKLDNTRNQHTRTLLVRRVQIDAARRELPAYFVRLELPYEFERQLRPARATELIVVIEAVDGEHVAARAQPREAEPAVGQRGRSRRARSWLRRRNPWANSTNSLSPPYVLAPVVEPNDRYDGVA